MKTHHCRISGFLSFTRNLWTIKYKGNNIIFFYDIKIIKIIQYYISISLRFKIFKFYFPSILPIEYFLKKNTATLYL